MTAPPVGSPEWKAHRRRMLGRLARRAPIAVLCGLGIAHLVIAAGLLGDGDPEPAAPPPAVVTAGTTDTTTRLQALEASGLTFEAADLTSWCNRYHNANDGQLALRYGDMAQLPWLQDLALDGTIHRHEPLVAPSQRLWDVLNDVQNGLPLDAVAFDSAAAELTAACETGYLVLLGTEWPWPGWTRPEHA